jgi:hypothetical protein
MNKQTVDIIGSFIPLLNETININNVIDNGGGSYTLEVDCTWWLSIAQTYSIGGNDYKVTSFVINESITIQSVGIAVLPVVTSFDISAPEYIHGTLKMAQNEVDGQTDKTILCPFTYLFEAVTDRKNTDEESAIDREVDLRIFWLNSANTKDWLTNDHYTNVIDPMQQMVDLFIDKIKDSKLFTDEMRYDCLPLINVSENGLQVKSIFDCNLSGIELRLFAEIREDLSCTNNNKC